LIGSAAAFPCRRDSLKRNESCCSKPGQRVHRTYNRNQMTPSPIYLQRER
jgi:hypothetical protein